MDKVEIIVCSEDGDTDTASGEEDFSHIHSHFD